MTHLIHSLSPALELRGKERLPEMWKERGAGVGAGRGTQQAQLQGGSLWDPSQLRGWQAELAQGMVSLGEGQQRRTRGLEGG